MLLQNRQTARNSDWSEVAPGVAESSRTGEFIFFALPAIGILAVIIFGAVDVWALGLLSALVGAVGILWLTDSWRSGEFRFSTSPLQIPLGGLIVIGLVQLLPFRGAGDASGLLGIPLSNALSFAPTQTRFAVVQLVTYAVFFAAALSFIGTRSRLQKTVVTVIVFGAAIAFFAVLQQLANLEGIYGLRQNANAFTFGPYVNRHHFAALMEMPIALTLALFFGNATTKNKRIFLLLAAAVMGIAIILTGSRGGLISFVAILVFVVAANVLRRKSRDEIDADDGGDDEPRTKFRRSLTLIGGGLALIFGLLGAVIMLGADEALLRSSGLTLDTGDISNGRSHFWATALKIIGDYPILGTGLDSFGAAFTRYDTWNGTVRVEQAHNDYLQILADAGVLGLLCVLSFIVLLFKTSLRIITKSSDNFRRSTALGALAGCLGLVIHSIFDFPLRTPANGYFFLIFAVLATANINYSKPARRKN